MNKLKLQERDFILLLLVGVFLGIAQSVDGSTLNNFLKEKFNMMIIQRSALEMPRELPGFLVFLIIGFLYTLGDIRIAVIANICAAFGMLLLGIIPPVFAIALICIFIYSAGQHIYMPLSNTIAMSFASDRMLGRKLGQVSAANTAALVVGSGLLWLLFKFFKVSFSVTFTIGAAAFITAAVLLAMMNPNRTTQLKTRFVFRKEYRLFYWLSILYGARKQIFITFGPWVLVDVFKQKVTTMTTLFFIISVFSIVFRPFTGYLIDRIGEKFVLGCEALVLFLVCLGYAFATDILPLSGAVVLISVCYIVDQLFNSASMARATYLRKIALRDEDVSPTLSLGISIDHVMSMFLPVIGGIVWYESGSNGYKYVFLGGAAVAVLNFISARFINTGMKTS
ncbi:MAG: MFS transporter [Ruminiclostridium sp.]|nr:MFS transporter [Ruminiclostridium sp.]